MRTIALMNQKGGVGKTTCAVNIASCLARMRHKVLLIDMDPQANLTVHVNLDPRTAERSIYPVLMGEIPLADAVHEVDGEYFDFVPSTLELTGAEIELAGQLGRERLLRKALDVLFFGGAEYDYVLVDCPPSLGLLVLNALTAVREVFIPMQAQFFALQGLSRLLDIVRLVQTRLNSALQITGIIPCMFDARTNLSHEVVEDLRKYFEDGVFRTVIRHNIRLAEAPSYGKTIFRYAPSSAGAQDFLALCREIRRRQKKAEREAAEKTDRITRDDLPVKEEPAGPISRLSEEEIRSAALGEKNSGPAHARQPEKKL